MTMSRSSTNSREVHCLAANAPIHRSRRRGLNAPVVEKRTQQRLWQKKYYDHILRTNERWESVACYIWLNPVRKGLCKRAEDWPYSGSFTVDWRKLMALGVDPWVPPWKKDLT